MVITSQQVSICNTVSDFLVSTAQTRNA